MDFQCSIYSHPHTEGSYLQCLRSSEKVIFDYASRQPANVTSLTAPQMMFALQERTVLSTAVLGIFDKFCEVTFQNSQRLKESFNSWWEFRQWARRLFQGEGNWYHGGFRDDKLDLFGTLHSRIADTFPEPVRSKLANVPCGSLFTSDVSAYVASAPSGDAAIIIPWNLYFFIYLGSSLLFRYLDMFVKYTGGEDQKRDRQIEDECDKALRLLTQYAADCCDVGPRLVRMPSLLVQSLLNIGTGLGDLLEAKPVSDAAIITHAALYYILLHELGHIALGHPNSQHYVPVICEPGQDLILYTTTTVQEEEADSFAIRHFLTSAINLIPGPDDLKLLGPCFVFALYRFREAVFTRWRALVLEFLQKQGKDWHIHDHHLMGGNSVKLWTQSKGSSELVELPVHPPTGQRLARVAEECIQYAKINRSKNWRLAVIVALLPTLEKLMDDICDQILLEGAADQDASYSAQRMAEKISSGNTDSIFPI